MIVTIAAPVARTSAAIPIGGEERGYLWGRFALISSALFGSEAIRI